MATSSHKRPELSDYGLALDLDGIPSQMDAVFSNHSGAVGQAEQDNLTALGLGLGAGAGAGMGMGMGMEERGKTTTSPESSSGRKMSGNSSTDQSTPWRRSSKDEAQDPPTWSEMKTKAGKERKRLPLACIACRRKKIRCSGEKPACKHCVRSRIPCVYKVTTRKAAPRTDYMAMLDKRLKRMEDRVIKLIPKDSLPSVANVGHSVVKPALLASSPAPQPAKKRAAEQAFGGDLDEWSKGKGPDLETIAGLPARGRHGDEHKLLSEGAECLPSQQIQEHLAEVYFDFVYGQSYPLLHKPSFMRRLAAGKVPPVLILAMCAISARFSTHPELRSEPCFLRGDNWAAKAREIALRRYDSPNITILIVYLMLGLHEFGTCQGGRSWMFGGMAQRMAYALQLHKENEYDPLNNDPKKKPLSATDREIRRRTMWSCFLMDRFNSSGTDRPLFVHEQYIEVQLPVKEHLYINEIHAPTETLEGEVPNPVPPDSGQLEDARDNMGVVAYTVRLVTIWGKLIKYMNLGGKEREKERMWSPSSTFYQIANEAKEFKASLPDMLTYSPENLKSHEVGRTSNQFLYLHIMWHQIMLFMHRFALPSTAGSRPPKDMPHDFLTKSARSALEAANQISILVNEAMDHNVVAPFAGYSAFFSSTVHVHGVFSKNPKLEAQSKKYLAYNVRYLTKMRKYWGMLNYMAENLKDLYRQHAEALLKGSAETSDNKKGAIFQYGDWFDRYPHGVSKTDYEDAAQSNNNEPGAEAVLGQKSDLQSVEEFFASLAPPSKTAHVHKQARKNKAKSISKPDVTDFSHTETQPVPRHHSLPQPIQSTSVQQQRQQPMNQVNIVPQDALKTAIATGYDASSLFAQQAAQQSQPQQQSTHFPAAYSTPHTHFNSLPTLNTNPTMIHHSHSHQMNMSPFPDITADFNSAFWNPDALGMANNEFFDPMSNYFVPFNVEPPTMGGDDGTFGQPNAETYGFGMGTGATVDLDMLQAHGGMRGRQ